MGVTVLSEGQRSLVLLDSTTATLGNGAVYTSSQFDISGFKEIRVSVFADQVSASNGVDVQQAADGTNYDHSNQTTYTPLSIKTLQVDGINVVAPKGRIVYTNGGTGQGTFRLYTFAIA